MYTHTHTLRRFDSVYSLDAFKLHKHGWGWGGGGGGEVDAWAGICPVKMTHERQGWEELWVGLCHDTL